MVSYPGSVAIKNSAAPVLGPRFLSPSDTGSVSLERAKSRTSSRRFGLFLRAFPEQMHRGKTRLRRGPNQHTRF
jgi:hypothetical protein